MKNIIYAGWIREKSFGEADDIIYLGVDGGTYTDSADPSASIYNLNEGNYFDGTDIPLADVLQGNIARKQVSVCYWITDQQCNKDEAQEQFLKKLYGAADCEFRSHYSDITGYLWTDEDLVIGGHDLLDELRSNVGSFVILDITVHD
jgi:hypothetical protein